jgi:hypothetical protein
MQGGAEVPRKDKTRSGKIMRRSQPSELIDDRSFKMLSFRSLDGYREKKEGTRLIFH